MAWRPVLDHRSHPDEADTVRDQGAHVTTARVGDPRPETIEREQIEQMPGIASTSFGLPHHHRADFARLADEHGVAESMHQPMKPLSVAGGLEADRHRWPPRSVELLYGSAVVGELPLEEFAGGRVEHSSLLRSRVEITSDESKRAASWRWVW
jgi:hypothetical protein